MNISFLNISCCFFLLPILFSCGDVQNTGSAVPKKNTRNILWQEEFNGEKLNTGRWEYQIGRGNNGWGNNELQYYTGREKNAHVENGHLVITALAENYKGQPYTSARIRTFKKFDFKFGRVDVRAKLPEGQGIWPAIWMMPTDRRYGGWPKSGEIDIMELVGHKPDTIHGTIHFGDSWPNNKAKGKNTGLKTGKFSDDFHIFSIIWEKDKITWLLDDIEYSSIQKEDILPHPWPFNERFHLILNVAVGGNWPGYPDDTTVLPQQMKVDYIRVYGGGSE